jgi:hypothetical protein
MRPKSKSVHQKKKKKKERKKEKAKIIVKGQDRMVRADLGKSGQNYLAELWKQPRCPTTDEGIKKMWYLYTMEFYAAMKKNEMLSFAGKWVELENIILSEVSLAQKTKNCMFSLICGH